MNQSRRRAPNWLGWYALCTAVGTLGFWLFDDSSLVDSFIMALMLFPAFIGFAALPVLILVWILLTAVHDLLGL